MALLPGLRLLDAVRTESLNLTFTCLGEKLLNPPSRRDTPMGMKTLRILLTSSALVLAAALAACPSHASPPVSNHSVTAYNKTTDTGNTSVDTLTLGTAPTVTAVISDSASSRMELAFQRICFPNGLGGQNCCETTPGRPDSCGLDVRPHTGEPKPATTASLTAPSIYVVHYAATDRSRQYGSMRLRSNITIRRNV